MNEWINKCITKETDEAANKNTKLTESSDKLSY